MSAKEEVINATPEKGDEKTDRNGVIQLRDRNDRNTLAAIVTSPIMPSDLEVVGTIQSAGIRPIGASHLDVVGTLGTNRPITSSHLRIAEMMGSRPIFFDDEKFIDDVEMPGHRPILVSNPALINAEMVLANRPIFSNTVDDAPAMMGYLD
ncbi:hypothetical protein [Myxacorys almedinensis]|uniref:Uncharacterized protein n=1 Tax=Myxacorys almedinensis A TaxID=2690445 RepID=A0A8J7YYL8_9CYAN|nr:hypothetical protein [Myxacorys almedinensis]NDJ16934.1 hypothetical protein [Myxacorys almedinensis A]